jgi:hypothetical protein
VSRRFGRRKAGSEEGNAGWIYADLFLALTIVGLGSAVISNVSADGSSTPTTVANQTFRLSCNEFFIPLSHAQVAAGKSAIGAVIDSAVSAEIARRGWKPEQAKPGLVILAGGLAGGEDAGRGDARAQAELMTVRGSTGILTNVEFRTIGASAVDVNGQRKSVGGAGNFGLIMYLVYSGGPLQEECNQ